MRARRVPPATAVAVPRVSVIQWERHTRPGSFLSSQTKIEMAKIIFPNLYSDERRRRRDQAAAATEARAGRKTLERTLRFAVFGRCVTYICVAVIMLTEKPCVGFRLTVLEHE
jgi:hypothetical protein